jgi:uncharacterized protein YkwD
MSDEWNKQFSDWLGKEWFNIPIEPDKPSPPPSPTPPPLPPIPIPIVPPPPPAPLFNELNTKLLELHNNQRKNGAGVLSLEKRLIEAAQKHADWMSSTQKMSHTGIQGSSHLDRISREGYKSFGSGENIAMGYNDENAVMNGWMNSSGHRANILNKGWREAGFGETTDGSNRRWWCAVFAVPASSSTTEKVLLVQSGGIVAEGRDQGISFEDDQAQHSFGATWIEPK